MKERPQALAVLIAVFLFGCLVGSAGSYLWLKRSPDLNRRSPDLNRRYPDFGDNGLKNGPLPRPEPPNFKIILQLTPEQDARIKEIVAESRKKMAEFRKQTDAFHFEQNAKIRAILSEMNRQLTSILNEEQQKKFDAWQKEFENARRRPPRRRDFPPQPQ